MEILTVIRVSKLLGLNTTMYFVCRTLAMIRIPTRVAQSVDCFERPSMGSAIGNQTMVLCHGKM